MSYTIFGTDGCHLCEDAQALLAQVVEHIPVTVYYEDIAEDEALVELYGVRIPVLRHDESGDELGWPFDLPGLANWLAGHSSNIGKEL